ncbi:MAG: hypothetical protein KC413_01260, partial [Anaerolineales bacterium]|nr:hypothetical protein [Anaerolineales bacterium]
MSERWFLTKIYYSLADVENEEDANGNTILLDFVRPTMAYMKEEGWIRWGIFMRFSEGGYHIRYQVYGDEAVLAEKAAPYLANVLQELRLKHPEVSLHPMQLTPLAVRLNQKWGGVKEGFDLQMPDAHEMGLMYNTGEDEIFESDEAFARHYDLHSDACARALDLLSWKPSYNLRKTVARLLVDDFLRMTDLTSLERYYFLTYLRMEWIDYFELTPADLAPSHTVYETRKARYQAYFTQKEAQDDNLAMLPEPLRPFYRQWLASLRDKVPPVVGRDANGHLTPHGSLRLMAF